jgi:hypothetical protein
MLGLIVEYKSRMKEIYPKLLAIHSGMFTEDERRIMSLHNFDENKIKTLAKKIIDVIHQRKGEEAGEKFAQKGYMSKTSKNRPKKVDKTSTDKDAGDPDSDAGDGERPEFFPSNFPIDNDNNNDQPPPPAGGAPPAGAILSPAEEKRLDNLKRRGVSDFDSEDESDSPTFPSSSSSGSPKFPSSSGSDSGRLRGALGGFGGK